MNMPTPTLDTLARRFFSDLPLSEAHCRVCELLDSLTHDTLRTARIERHRLGSSLHFQENHTSALTPAVMF
jgi:hypothetical protein